MASVPEVAPSAPAALAPAIAPRHSQLVAAVNPYLFYGWVIVGCGFLAQMLTSVSTQGLSTYVVPLEQTFGWTAAQTAAGRSVQQVNALFGPANGWLVDRFGSRRVMTVGVLIFAAGFFWFSRVDSLVTYYAACFTMEVGQQLVGLLVVSVAVNNWFRRKRSTAMGVAVLGLAAAGATLLPALVWVQDTYGWRTAALSTAIGMLIVGAPIVLLMRDAPEPYGLLPDGDRPGAVDASPARQRGGGLVPFTFGEALHTRAFWLIAAGLTLAMLAQSAIIVWQFPYIEGRLDRATAALILTVINVFNMVGRLLGGMLGDRMPKHRLMGLNLLGTTIATFILALAGSLPLLVAYGALYGFCWGVRTPVVQALQGDYFGRPAFGKIVGLTQTLTAPFSIVAPILVGVAFDAQHSYAPSFLTLAVLSGIAALLFFAAARPPAPASHTPAVQLA